jgi:diacylglycerol kinase (ATP)
VSNAPVVLLVNPTSGRGRGGRLAPDAARRLNERGVDTVITVATSAEETAALARKAVTENVAALVACGGDGTVHTVLQAVAGTDLPFGIIPVGTGDDNARTLGLPLDDPAAAADAVADALAAGRTRTIDLATVTTGDGVTEWFLGVLSSGFDSNVNERANRITWPKGQARYFVSILGELRTFRPVPYRVVIDDEVLTGKGMLVSVGNGISYGGGMKVCPGAIVDDGLLDLTWLSEVGTGTFLKVFPSVYKGTHVSHPSVRTFRGHRIRIEAPGQIAYADGERIGPLPVDIEIHPGALRVLAPA